MELDDKGEVKAVVAEAQPTPESDTTSKVGKSMAFCAVSDRFLVC